MSLCRFQVVMVEAEDKSEAAVALVSETKVEKRTFLGLKASKFQI